MNKEDIIKYATKVCDAYKTIPADSLRNSVTYQSILDNDIMKKKGFHDELCLPAAMLPKKECGEIYVGFYPVYFYDNGEMGIMSAYYSTKTKTTAKFGPFRTGEEFAEELSQYSETKLFNYICDNLKAYADFIITYDNAKYNLERRLVDLPKLPLMNCLENEYLGDRIEVALEYIVNPYCYDVLKYKSIICDEFSQSVKMCISDVSQARFYDKSVWEPFDMKGAKKIISKVKKSIKKRQEREKELFNELVVLDNGNKK